MRVGTLAALLLALGLLAASPATATFEQVDIFSGTATLPPEPSKYAEEVQLGGAGGMAINITGAGGVPAGTVYAAGDSSGPYVARFGPDGEFRKAWNLGEDPPHPCGPEGEPAHPVCQSRGAGSSASSVDVEVDQTTGNLYVFNINTASGEKNTIHVYSPDGSALIAEFGEKASSGETTAESPEKIHGTAGNGNIAVDAAGNVYVMDADEAAGHNFYHRLMVFKPQSPGDYEHYVYAGQSNDLQAGFLGETEYPMRPVADAAGEIYVSGDNTILKLDPSQPSAPPLCKFHYGPGGINAITVNPGSGEAFFFTYTDRKIHQLSPCDPEGNFAETGTFGLSPKRNYISAMAFNPARQFDLTRPAGMLYAAAPSGEGGKFEPYGVSGFLEESALGYVFSRPVESPPQVESESVSRVTATTATLEAQINPKGSQTRYAFQYLTQAEYEANEPADRFAGATEAPLGGAELGSGQEAISAAAALSGLTPDTEYRYRAIATSHCSSEDKEKICEGEGTGLTFRTFPAQAPGLPDRRAWELVSPPDKHGGEVIPAQPDIGSCPGAECKPGVSATRFPLQSSPGGEAVAYQGQPFSFSEGAIHENEYVSRRDAKTGWQTTTLSPALAGRGERQGYVGFDTGLAHGLLYQTIPTLSPDAPGEYPDLYAQPSDNPLALGPLLATAPPNRAPGVAAGSFVLSYAGASADLSRVFFAANDALTEATPFAPAAFDGGASKNNLYEWSGGQLRLVNVSPGNAAAAPGASFGAGSAHAISADGSRAFWSDEAGQAYVRENGVSTRAIPDPGKFLAASAEGSKVLLSDGHVFDLETEAMTDLTEGKGGFQGIAGQSEDLSRVYFVDTAVLDETPNGQGALAEAGKYNLYAWHEGSARYVATLLSDDNLPGEGDWAASPSQRTAEASPGGRWVAFISKARLSGYDNTGPCETDHAGGYVSAPCGEAFLYDSATGELRCASCNPSAARPLGGTQLRLIGGRAGSLDYLPQPRYLTDSGRLYFDSRDSLAPADTNSGVEDVYQYEPEGVGTCQRPGGCISLISAGHEAVDSNLLAVDEDGSDVFFTSRDELVLKDRDELIDLYDAREEGGIPAETEVAGAGCQGEACQAAISPPNDPTPGSSSFEGAGNVNERKAAKKHKKKHKHAKKHSHKRAHNRAASHDRGGAK